MWLSNRAPTEPLQETVAAFAQVTVSGNPAAVWLDGERRQIPVAAPGGYHWRPKVGETVLVLKCGNEQQLCVNGTSNSSERVLEAGDIWISCTPESGIHLHTNGTIELIGTVIANGSVLSASKKGAAE